jgi:pyrimidine-specific ribonucleoside hydrolase
MEQTVKAENSIPVYLDVDTGIDDALAILLAIRHPALEVRGITTVVGNVDLEQVTRNTLQVLEVAGALDVPVVSGASRPLLAPPRSSAFVHGADGLGYSGLPQPNRQPASNDAVSFLRDELMSAAEPIDLIALAPLTNLALLFQTAPEVKSKINKIALMGGSAATGNATAVAEFNIFHDPEAADIVFGAGVPILMYGLDVFGRVGFNREEVRRWFASEEQLAPKPYPQSVSELAAHLFYFMMRTFGSEAVTIGDAGCVAVLIDSSGLTTEKLPVFIETEGRFSRGQTIVDRRPVAFLARLGEERVEPHVEVSLDIDGEYYRRMFREAVGV